MAYSSESYNLQNCMNCPSASRSQPPCQRMGRYSDGSVVPIAREDLGPKCPFAVSWETVKALALRYPDIPRTSQDGYYAIGKIRASIDLRRGIPANLLELGISTETGLERMLWLDTSNGRNYYFLQAVNPSDYNRFQEWFLRSRIGPVPVDLAGKAQIVFVRSLDYLGPALINQFQNLFTWPSLVIMAASAAIMIGAAIEPAGWILFVRNATVYFGLGACLFQASDSLVRSAMAISQAVSRTDLERAAKLFANFLAQIIQFGGQLIFSALLKGRDAWINAGKPPVVSTRVNWNLVHESVKTPTSQLTGEAFTDFPRFQYSTVSEVRTWLSSKGFNKVADAEGVNSEIWIRTRQSLLGEAKIEAVRIDPTGHAPNARALAAKPEGRIEMTGVAGASDSVRLPQWGTGPHMHKELLDLNNLNRYMEAATQAVKFADWNTPSPGGAIGFQVEHIQLRP